MFAAQSQTLTAPNTNTTEPPPPPPAGLSCNATTYTHIADIQGSSATPTSATPLTGTQVTTVGIVVGTSFGNNSRRGFYIADPQPDSRPETSDSVFVYVGSTTLPFTVAVGDRVVVAGTAGEFGGNTQVVLTQVAKVSSCVLGLVSGQQGKIIPAVYGIYNKQIAVLV